MRRVVNYLNNKDILKEIHKSKSSYCYFANGSSDYDIILTSKDDIIAAIPTAIQNKKTKQIKTIIEEHSIQGIKIKADEATLLLKPISVTDLVFRVMTKVHIPFMELKQVDKSLDVRSLFDPKLFLDISTSPVDVSSIDIVETDNFDDADLSDIEVPVTVAIIDGKPAKYSKINFPAFQHFKLDDLNNIICIGKSHWKGDLTNGKFSTSHGKVTNTLATMYMKLCDKYATRSNWRNYCVDTKTDALTQRGWLGINEITESDTILSYSDNNLKWSSIKSIYRGEYNGLMHHITSRNIDALVTPNHKFVTARGLVEAELIEKNDQIIIMGNGVVAPAIASFTDSFVELAGWIMSSGRSISKNAYNNIIKCITISKNATSSAVRIRQFRQCLSDVGYQFTEENRGKFINFRLWPESSEQFVSTFKTNNLTMEFILSLTDSQRDLLINTMVDGNMSYRQQDKEHVDLFQALLALSGKKSTITDNADKLVINMFSKRSNKISGEYLNFNGGLNNGTDINRDKGKSEFPNNPTVPYNDMVWCPETEYGCFVARRNGTVYLTGNTYNDEMRAHALLQLSTVGLQFDESKSDNPFSYLTSCITNAFTRVLNVEKRNQNIRDDILVMNSLNPSFSRQNSVSSENHYDSE